MTPQVLAAVCAWELVALTSGMVPTITALAHRTPRWIRAGGLAAATVWLWAHIMIDDGGG